MKIVTHYQFPPIPIRTLDWSAIDSNTFDADFDGERYVTKCPIGRGATEIDAIRDLLNQIEEAQ